MPVTSKTVDAENLNASFQCFAKSPVVRVEKLAGDASSRHYYRLFTKSSEAFVLQVSESFQDVDSHPFICGQKILAGIGVPVPDVVEIKENLGWILLGDLGDLTLQQKPDAAFYYAAVDLLLHWSKDAHAHNQKLDARLRQKAPHFAWAFDVEKLSFEMQYTQEHLVEKLLGRREDFARMSFKNTKFLAERPRVYCHRDYHSRNLMLKDGHRLFVIDFQDARMGPCTYDLVSLLWDPYAGLSPTFRDELYNYWHEKAQVAQISGANDSALVEELERMKLQRLMKAAGSYASFLNLKGRSDYLPHIAPALAESALAIKKIKSMGKALPEDEEILTLIQAMQKEIPAILKK